MLFDCLHVDGDDLLDRPARARFGALAARVPEELRVPRLEVNDAVEAERVLDEALARGHEGVMVKALDSPYEAGRRGAEILYVDYRAENVEAGAKRGWQVILQETPAKTWSAFRQYGFIPDSHGL